MASLLGGLASIRVALRASKFSCASASMCECVRMSGVVCHSCRAVRRMSGRWAHIAGVWSTAVIMLLVALACFFPVDALCVFVRLARTRHRRGAEQ